MPSIADRMLAGSAIPNLFATHGESVSILSGLDAGRTFTAIREIESDQILSTELGEDPRAKIFLRFVIGAVPRIGQSGRVQTDDGKQWNAVRLQEAGFLTSDYELTEFVAGKDS